MDPIGSPGSCNPKTEDEVGETIVRVNLARAHTDTKKGRLRRLVKEEAEVHWLEVLSDAEPVLCKTASLKESEDGESPLARCY